MRQRKSLLSCFLVTLLLSSSGYSQGFDDEIDEIYGYVKETSRFCDEWGISLDSLWWQATADGIELGKVIEIERTSFDPVTGNYAEVIEHSKIKSPHFTFDTGFRFSLAHDLPDHGCHLGFTWTHFYTSASVKAKSDLISGATDTSSVSGDTYEAFVPYWEGLAQNFPDSSHGKWKLELDLFDFSAGRMFNFSRCFILAPHIGLRAAWVRQHYHVSSHAHHTGAFNGQSYHYDSKVNATCNFFGVGPRVGFDGELMLGCGFSFFGAASGSLVYGKFDSHSKEHLKNYDFFFDRFDVYEDHAKGESHYCSRAITELSFGIRWKDEFRICRWDFPVMIALAWEQQGFYNFNMFSFDSDSFQNDSSSSFEFGPDANLRRSQEKRGDLYTQGVTLSTRIGF